MFVTAPPAGSSPVPTTGSDAILGSARFIVLMRIEAVPPDDAAGLHLVTCVTRFAGDVIRPPASITVNIVKARAVITARRPGARTAGEISQMRIAVNAATMPAT